MARRSLRPQLNQIRTWVQQGRTDAWIAHQLEVTVQQIAAFKRDNDLAPAEPAPETEGADILEDEFDLRAQDDARIAEELEAAEAERLKREAEEAERAAEEAKRKAEAGEEDDEDDKPARRRGRRGGRGRRRGASTGPYEGTFDHGDEGYGLWLDPSVQDNAVYAEHWAGHRAIEVTVEEDQIVIRRVGGDTEE
ncbi:hypothetical protein [Paraconexibacter algicola]|uniref:Uncharacterized protein n=1 Tax=Paraconexibacter algicola TaxID=2133960 RepID=A0A2T4ULV0_9ACTN|nr:hypothetical protein [Paraconexibacter algicola]PTL60210.1 hypothetical protein C7Y72_11465 [Paraconexibacter algicola]